MSPVYRKKKKGIELIPFKVSMPFYSYLLLVVVFVSFSFVLVLRVEDTDLAALVLDFAVVSRFDADLEDADAFAGVDSLDLLKVRLLLADEGLEAAIPDLVVVCLREVAASCREGLFDLVLTEDGLSDLLIVPVLLIVLVSLFVLVRVVVRVVVDVVVVLDLFDLALLPVRVLL